MSIDYVRVLILLVFAHLVGDFVIRFRWLRHKKRTFAGRLVHSLIHAALAYLIISDWVLWQIPVVVGVTHFLIDWGKASLKPKRWWIFVIDQILHGIVLMLMAGYVVTFGRALPLWFSYYAGITWPLMVLACAFLLLVPCGGYLIGGMMAPYQSQLERHYARQAKPGVEEVKKPVKGIEEGGKVIGYLERLLILVFILNNQYAGIGFLIAAKSIFRFGEFKESENRMEAEYIIIGTFASFLYAIVISQGARWLLAH